MNPLIGKSCHGFGWAGQKNQNQFPEYGPAPYLRQPSTIEQEELYAKPTNMEKT